MAIEVMGTGPMGDQRPLRIEVDAGRIVVKNMATGGLEVDRPAFGYEAVLAKEIERLRIIFRVNMLRHVPNITHAEIDAHLNNDFKPAE